MPKTILITGASSGFGEAAALRFADEGWNVVATMRKPRSGGSLDGRDNVLVTRLDVQDRSTIAAAVAQGVARYGGIDALVNNAGYGQFGVFEGVSRERILAQFDVNLFGLMDVTREVLPIMRERKAGVIVNVSSSGGVIALPMLSIYHASKFALEGFSESLSFELASQGIVVKLVEPGGAATNFGPRTEQEAGALDVPESYAAFQAHVQAIYTGMSETFGTTAEEVASTIYMAATDGTDRMRYVIGNDVAPIIDARRSMPDQAYIDMIRSQFAPPPGT